jgi:hypothetical protein
MVIQISGIRVIFMNFNGNVIKITRLFHKIVVKGRAFII